MIEKQPQMRFSLQACLEGRDLRPVERAHDLRIGVHREAVQRVFGEHDQVHAGKLRRALPTICDDALGLRGKSAFACDVRQLQLHEADHDAVPAIC